MGDCRWAQRDKAAVAKLESWRPGLGEDDLLAVNAVSRLLSAEDPVMPTHDSGHCKRHAAEQSLRIEISWIAWIERSPGNTRCLKPGSVDLESVCHSMISLWWQSFKVEMACSCSEVGLQDEVLLINESPMDKRVGWESTKEEGDVLWYAAVPRAADGRRFSPTPRLEHPCLFAQTVKNQSERIVAPDVVRIEGTSEGWNRNYQE